MTVSYQVKMRASRLIMMTQLTINSTLTSVVAIQEWKRVTHPVG